MTEPAMEQHQQQRQPSPLTAPEAPNANLNPNSNPSISINNLPPPTFAPLFALVSNTTTRTTHHPHVRYIFSDDDPDILTRELADLVDADPSLSPNPGTSASASSLHPPHSHSHHPRPGQGYRHNHRAMLLDLAPAGSGAGYDVAWASSLSPSWAVLGAQLSPISPPSSSDGQSHHHDGNPYEREGNGNGGNRPDRLMLRIEGVESSEGGGSGGGSSDFLRASGDMASRQPGSGSASASGHSAGGGDDYAGLVDEFDRRMAVLRKVADAGEERRRKIAVDADAAQTAARGPMQGLGVGGLIG
ncbi:hypothetical protein F5B20DRAFT_550826 [Whalleya microplaca]|nr:hypothetical protein F5B20DRAFT_550826 [Whalleya microplaca]